MRLLLAANVGLAVSALVTRLVEIVARRRAMLDLPNERNLHSIPTPRLGGIGIATGSLLALAVAVGGTPDQRLVPLVGAALFLSAFGLVDDTRHISVVAKYGAQLAAALIAAWTLTPILHVQLAGLTLSLDGPLALVLTTLWITALVNAFNFMDGIDGMTGGVFVVVILVALQLTQGSAHPLLISLGAATLGFLIWNVHPASIFMGDVGSQFLGYWAAVALLLQPSADVEVVPVFLLLAPILFDTGVTLWQRAREGKDIFAGHREHLYQQLVLAGVDQRTISFGYAAACALCGLGAVVYPSLAPIGQAVAVIGVLTLGLAYRAAVRRLAARA
jgi:UDP-N-acetylmuramyl pentapeptide phosphotransferase/UDP-N-acetylglucosamine-1-phosphate transferase